MLMLMLMLRTYIISIYTIHACARFLDFINLSAEDADEVGAGGSVEVAQSVKLMSLHASKGLEFDCVFIIDIEEGKRAIECDDSLPSILMEVIV
jgi:superfamily I DNA/RNA helicase